MNFVEPYNFSYIHQQLDQETSIRKYFEEIIPKDSLMHLEKVSPWQSLWISPFATQFTINHFNH